MARPKKIGLSYFPLDCQMDDKIEMLEAEHELIGFAVYIKLLQSIYQTEDGELDMSIVFRWKTLGKTYGIPTENLRNMVSTMLEVGLFCKKCFDERRVLTSNGIKKRIGQVSELRFKERKRKEKPVEGSFPPGKPENSDRKSTQKEKEKEKEKETSFKEENKASPPTLFENQNPELPFELEPVEPKNPKEKKVAPKKEKVTEHLFRDSPFFDFPKFLTQFPEPRYEDVNLEHYYHAAADWSAENGKKKVDWIAAVRRWIREDASKGQLKTKNLPTHGQPTYSGKQQQRPFDDFDPSEVARALAS